jgi:deoxynucleotide monophosphate kinase-like protein
MLLIGLAGYKNSGKDTVGKHLVENWGFTQYAFADKVKEAACALVDITIEQLESWKNDPSILVHIDEGPFEGRGITFREFLQRFGTEMGRGVFGKDFWINQLNHEIMVVDGLDPFHHKIVITDVRFPNEVQYIKRRRGQMFWIDRPECSSDGHESEMLVLDEPIIISNNDSLETLYGRIDNIMMGLHSA